MQTCVNYIKATPLPKCIGVLTIGTINENNTNVTVYFENTATSRVDVFPATSNGSGVVSVDMVDFDFVVDSTYKITIGKNLTKKDITIGAETNEAVLLPIEVWNGVIIEDYTIIGA